MTRSAAPLVGTIAALKPDDVLDLKVPGDPTVAVRVTVRFIERYPEVTRITMRDSQGGKHLRAANEYDPVSHIGTLVTP